MEKTIHATVTHYFEALRHGDSKAIDRLIAASMRQLSALAHQMLDKYPILRIFNENTDDVASGALGRMAKYLKTNPPRDAQHFLNLAAINIRRELKELWRQHMGPTGIRSLHRAGLDQCDMALVLAALEMRIKGEIEQLDSAGNKNELNRAQADLRRLSKGDFSGEFKKLAERLSEKVKRGELQASSVDPEVFERKSRVVKGWYARYGPGGLEQPWVFGNGDPENPGVPEPQDPSPNPASQVAEADASLDFDDLLEWLAPERRHIVDMHIRQQMTQRDIARILLLLEHEAEALVKAGRLDEEGLKQLRKGEIVEEVAPQAEVLCQAAREKRLPDSLPENAIENKERSVRRWWKDAFDQLAVYLINHLESTERQLAEMIYVNGLSDNEAMEAMDLDESELQALKESIRLSLSSLMCVT